MCLRSEGVMYHRDFLHKFWFNDFNTSLILSLIKIRTLKIVQLLRYSQGNTQSIFCNNFKPIISISSIKINLVRFER